MAALPVAYLELWHIRN
jgi:hypothetical protein